MAGTITQAWHELGMIKKVVCTCTADVADGSYPATDLSKPIDGYLLKIVTDPQTTAPTDDYDITLIDDDGFDVLESQGLNRDTANTETVALATGTYFHPVVSSGTTLALTIANNSVNSAGIVVTLYFSASSG